MHWRIVEQGMEFGWLFMGIKHCHKRSIFGEIHRTDCLNYGEYRLKRHS